MELCAKTDTGEPCLIRLNQHTWNAYEYPSRLSFNDQMVEIRSKNEEKIIQLLKAAKIDQPEVESTTDSNIEAAGNPLNLSDETIAGLEQWGDPKETQRFREKIIEFVESEEYVEIARNGVPESGSE